MAQLVYFLNDPGLFDNAHFYRHIMSLSGTFEKKVIGNIVQTPTFHILGVKKDLKSSRKVHTSFEDLIICSELLPLFPTRLELGLIPNFGE